MDLTLDDGERARLTQLLSTHHATLSHEIHQTDARDFKRSLEREEEMTRRLLTRLRPPR